MSGAMGQGERAVGGMDSGLTYRLVFAIIAILACAVIAMAIYLPPMLRHAALAGVTQSNIQTADQIKAIRNYYAEHVVAKVIAGGSLTASAFHMGEADRIPLPATMVQDLSTLLESRAVGFRLVSPFPWPHRADRQLDDFQREAWAYLSQNTAQSLARVDMLEGKRVLRTAVADIMANQRCVDCHNGDRNLAKTDWKVGDMRAVLEVRRDVDEEMAGVDARAWTIIGSFAAMATLLSAVLLVIAKAVDHWTLEKREADGQIYHMAHHDSLTGLHNRMSITTIVDEAITARGGKGIGLALFFIDLDRFKEINDGLGHAAGDLLLKTVAKRLLAVVGKDDKVGRLGGDEFIVLQTKSQSQSDTEALAAAIVRTLAEPMSLGEHEVCISGSIGVMRGSTRKTTRTAMMRSADAAVYKAKDNGKNCYVMFTDAMDEEMASQRALEQSIREGLENRRFELHYQPIVSARTAQVRGFEALLRLTGSNGKPVPPSIFVPIAEELGMISRIGTWVVEEACRTATFWPNEITVSVNLSPAQFIALTTRDETISQVVKRVLLDTGLAPARLELEITEGIFIEKTDAIMTELTALKAMGVKIALDDFGTGYSSLAYLWKFPFDKLKIDRSFIILMGSGDPKMTSFVRTIASLGHTLNLKVTAEGIETHDQAAFVRALGVDFIQGYLYGKGMPARDLSAFLLDPHRQLIGEAVASPSESVQSVTGSMQVARDDAEGGSATLIPPKPDARGLDAHTPTPLDEPFDPERYFADIAKLLPPVAAEPPATRTVKVTERAPIRAPAPVRPREPRAAVADAPSLAPQMPLPLAVQDAEPQQAVAMAGPAEAPASSSPEPKTQQPPTTATAPDPYRNAVMGRYAGGIRVSVRPGTSQLGQKPE